jgi:class 3 adenylate cyclase/tetratricopeptide (TPR) repeat protein
VVICASCGHENGEGAKFCEECGFSFAAALMGAREQRKTVTILFCDLSGSTALGERVDPERLRTLLARYFERMKGIVESHGGTVEKFIGDAVMAVFGVPVLHEDDALRAVRAAVEMRDALPELGIGGRIGVMTGEVVTGTEERLATGDAVNVAARLEQAAQPGEVLVGQPTLALVEGAVEVVPVEPLVLKGKSQPVPAYRLLGVRSALERRQEARFVGRDRELALVRGAWQRVQAEQRCELLTLVGDAGVGKSRLCAELLTSIEATVVRGRCLPYGAGITYSPVVEVLKQLDLMPPEEAAAASIRSLLGKTEAAASAEEIAWAFRKTLEHASAARPLVAVIDDIHWGEETFLDLLEHVALLSSGAPILLLCIARPELAERRPSWPVTFRLEPLDGEEVDELIPERIVGELREKITRAAGGNPLFIGEMLAFAGGAEGEVVVPPTLRALLAARLDQLETTERSVLERGAVEGELFHRGAVQALTSDGAQVTPRLAALVRKQLVRPEKTQFVGEDAFRFRHLLIRDAAYDALPKAMRAELHERFASWLRDHGTEFVELDEILGYHLEQACRYRAELGLDDGHQALAREAAERLGNAGRRAFQRSDAPAGVNLISRAVALLPADDPLRVDLIPNVRVVQGMVVDMGWADSALTEAVQAATTTGDRSLAAHALVQRGLLRLFTEPEVTPQELFDVADRAIAVFEELADDLGLARAWRLKAQAHYLGRRAGLSEEASARALEHVRRTGDRFEEREIAEWLLIALFLGPAPADEAARRCERLLESSAGEPVLKVQILGALAFLAAIQGCWADADELIARARTITNNLGESVWSFSFDYATLCLWKGDPAAAELEVRPWYESLQKIGERSHFSAFAQVLARAVYLQGRYDEAEQLTRECEGASRPNNVESQIMWRSTRAKVLARRGDLEAAERLGEEAVAIAGESDFLTTHAEALMDLAEVLQLAGRRESAEANIQEAVRLFELKRNVLGADRARGRLADLRD